MDGGMSLRLLTILSSSLVMDPTSHSRTNRAMMAEAILNISTLMLPT